jgi:hypothetical protein
LLIGRPPMAVSWLLAVAVFAGCQPGPGIPERLPGGPGVTPLGNLGSLPRANPQTIYLPIYSQIYSANNADPIHLAVTLSVRNTDARASIVLLRASYHDSGGKLVREYLETPVRIAPLAAATLFVAEGNTQGGSGASFLVEWLADGPVSEPVVEAVHVNTLGGQGLVFTTWGRPLAGASAGRDDAGATAPVGRSPE